MRPSYLGRKCSLGEQDNSELTVDSGVSASKLPPMVWRILGTEFGERFSYYSLRAVLTLYFLSIGFSEKEAVAQFAFTSSLAYFMPLFGGIIADVWWGRYRTILVFSLLYVVGAFALTLDAFTGGSAVGALAALVLISVGTGGIKPCVAAFGADQLESSQEAARNRYFANFYLSINLGSTLSFVVAPVLRNTLGFSAAFGAAAVVLSLALFIFISGRQSYKMTPPDASFYTSVSSSLWKRLRGARPYSNLEPDVVGRAMEKGLETPEATETAKVLSTAKTLLPLIFLLPCFWGLFEQQGSSWVLQASSMRRDGLLPFGWEVSPEMLQIFNPIFVALLVPCLTRLFESWPKMFHGPPPSPTQKITCGMFIAAVAFFCSAAVQHQVDMLGIGVVPVLLQVPQIFLITLAECLVSVTALEYFYAQAPPAAKTAASSLYLFTMSLGSLLYGLLYKILVFFSSFELLLAFAALMLLNAIVFFRVTDDRSRAAVQ